MATIFNDNELTIYANY